MMQGQGRCETRTLGMMMKPRQELQPQPQDPPAVHAHAYVHCIPSKGTAPACNAHGSGWSTQHVVWHRGPSARSIDSHCTLGTHPNSPPYNLDGCICQLRHDCLCQCLPLTVTLELRSRKMSEANPRTVLHTGSTTGVPLAMGLSKMSDHRWRTVPITGSTTGAPLAV